MFGFLHKKCRRSESESRSYWQGMYITYKEEHKNALADEQKFYDDRVGRMHREYREQIKRLEEQIYRLLHGSS